jgi:cyclic pyranopterin phosphate synthase
MSADSQSSIPSPLIDRFGRCMSYLRISVTDRCNLKCTYCRPDGDAFCPVAHESVLSFEEIFRVVRVAASLGVNKVRLTGGEPLVRRNLSKLVRMLKEIPEIHDLALSTNAVLLERHAKALADAGLTRVNISLDSLNPERFRKLSGGGKLETVLRGIRAAVESGFSPIKVNAVIMRGVNDGEIAELIDFGVEQGVQMRFIEFMPLCDGKSWAESHVPTHEMLARPEVRERLADIPSEHDGHAAARYIQLVKGKGDVGFISPMSNRFCDGCNRVRLTADGKIRACLPADDEKDVRAVMRDGGSDEDIAACFRRAAWTKNEVGVYNFEEQGRARSMIQIGG